MLLEDRFSEGLTGESPETVGWQLNTSRGGSEWSLTQEGACRVKHVASPYANDSLRHAVKLPSRYYLQFDARLDAHAGFSLVALAGRGGAAFYGAGKTVMWKVLPNLKQNFGWATVPRAVRAGVWHRYRILIDINQRVQEFYVDDMTEPAYRETGRDLRINLDDQRPVANFVEFRDYGLAKQAFESEFRNLKLVALKPGEQPADDSFQPASSGKPAGPAPAEVWRKPGRSESRHPDQPFVLNDQPELFLDDYLIAETKNLKRRLNKPQPYAANPILRG
ncbi:MAG: hypothetical protein KDA74_08650, partial [Planctomycetaceae bacterium]|nr:hypothetical protein [Planctomycetaceae bacterium]